MAYRKGESGNPKGRPKNTPNKTTTQIREAYQLLLENNLPKLQEWIDIIAKESPKDAINIIIHLSEYVLPKLQRQEIIQTEGKPKIKGIVFE